MRKVWAFILIGFVGCAIASCSEAPKPSADDLVPSDSSAGSYTEYLDKTLEEVEYSD
jgi:hypothetical protein